MQKEDKILKEFIKACYGQGDEQWLQQTLDLSGWDKLTSRLHENGLLGFVYDAAVKKKLHLIIPAEVLEIWKRHAHIIAMHNTLYEQEAANIFDVLNRAGLQYILLKGFGGMEDLYGSREIRAVSDIDILVTTEDFQKAKELLKNIGYRVKYADVLVQSSEEVNEDQLHEISMMKSMGQFSFCIDLHRHLNRYLDASAVSRLFPEHLLPWMEQVDYIQLGSTKVCCMRLETQFLFMIYHYILHHMMEGIKWLVDICQFNVTQGNTLDWRWIEAAVPNRNLHKLTAIALCLAGDITGDQRLMEHALSSGVTLPKPGRIEYWLYQNAPFMSSSVLKRYLVFLMLPASWKDRLRVLAYILFEPSASIEGRRVDVQRGAFRNVLYVTKRLFKLKGSAQ